MIKNNKSTIICLSVLLLAVMFCQTAHANEMQLQILNSGINLGWLNATIEMDGITPANSGMVTTWITDGGMSVGEIYNLMSTPFDIDSVLKVQNSIGNFSMMTDTWSNRHKAQYLNSTYGMLRSQMSVIYNSRNGLSSSPTCDSYFLDVGYHFGQAHVLSQMGNEIARKAAHEAMIHAVAEGLRNSGKLGCGFGTKVEWDSLELGAVDTPPEYEDLLPLVQALALNAIGITDPDDDTPSSPPGPVPPILVPSDPVDTIDQPNPPRVYGTDLTGSWDGGVVITLEGDKYIARRNGDSFLEIDTSTIHLSLVNQEIWNCRILLRNNSGGLFWTDSEATLSQTSYIGARQGASHTLAIRYGESISAVMVLERPVK